MRRIVFGSAALVAVTAATLAWGASAKPQVPETCTRQRVFSIPFTVDPPQPPEEEPVEVQLHVSTDRGVTWRPYAKANPDERSFPFRAAHDGEYWFMLRTLDRARKLRPAAPPAPEYKVIVDTVRPKLEFSAQRGEAGELNARWRVGDANLRADSLKIEYQVAGDDAWQSVALEPFHVESPDEIEAGQTTWWPAGAAEVITVRASATDKAGNRVESRRLVEALRGPNAEPAAREARRERPTARPRTDWPAEPTGDSPVADESAGEALPPRMSQQFPIGPPAGDGRAPGLTTFAKYPRTNTPDSDGPAAPVPPTFAGDPVSEAQGRYPELQLEPQGQREAFRGELLPPGVRPRMVSSRRFELEYDVDSVGPSGIGKVELWATRDGGQSWTSYGVDNDNRSPFLVSVDAEGTYGFRIVVESGTGLRGTPPQTGDMPDVWVGVDLTKPVAGLLAAEQGSGEAAGELVIRWEADDQLLAARPVSLSFSEAPSGPWSIIASGLENTGRYAWRLDNRVPDSVYLRLEVRDEAGNVRVVDTSETISLARLRPQGRIRDVRPVGEASRGARMYYNIFR